MKKTLTIILSILIVITTSLAPVYAFAPHKGEGNSSYDWLDKQYGKWTKDLRDPNTGAIKSGVQVTAKDKRGFISKIIKNPSSARIAKRLSLGLNTVGIALALRDMGYSAVDWVLDPANNAVKIKGGGWYATNGSCKTLATTPEASCALASLAYGHNLGYGLKRGRYVCSGYNAETKNWTVPNYDFSVSTNHRCGSDALVPLEDVAKQLQELAKQGNQTAQQVITETVQEMGEAGELDAELDAAAQQATQPELETGECQKGFKRIGEYCYSETDTETEPKPESQPQPFELPAFCEWTGLCETWKKTETNTEKTADNTEEIKEDTKTIREKISELFDWLTEKSDDDTQIDIDDKQLPDVDTQINFGGECPSDIVFNFDIYGKSVEFKLMQYSKLCPILSNYIKPVLYTLGAFFAVTIVGGRNESS